MTDSLTPEIQESVVELRAAYIGNAIEVDPDQDGGAYVVVRDLHLGDQYQPSQSWVGFHITFQYPEADVYPHFTDPSLSRANGQPLGQGFGQVTWRGKPVTQISRRSNRRSEAADTATTKLAKVLLWINQQ